MDKTAIKNYAVSARKKLIAAIKLKAEGLLLFSDCSKTPTHEEAVKKLNIGGIFIPKEQAHARLRLYTRLLAGGKTYDKDTYNRVIENVAYTWFNRLIALRYMEVNGYLPSNIRILSSCEPGRLEPDALRDVEQLDYVNQSKVAAILADKGYNIPEKLYKYILVSGCNALSSILPGMFQKIDDYTELLLPDTLFSENGIVYDLVNAIHEDNFNIKNQGQIEIIGWLYQYYTSEKKDEVFAALKKNVKITKDTIPAATQLFTPEWIVKYMVENSLGRLWLERNPDEELRKSWKYYVDEAEQEPQVIEQLQAMRNASPINSPKDIKFIDPCMGSGHILVYAFDVLFQIYRSTGYVERDIPNLILSHNLHGLDIDDRAGQLAYFALMMKARAYNRRFFRQDVVPQPMVFSAGGDSELSEYGSLIKVDELGEKPELPDNITVENTNEVYSFERNLIGWNYRRLLAQKYDVVVTNPPYMGASGMSAKLSEFVKKNHPNTKSDLCVAFIERNFDLIKANGYVSMITMHSWMFLSSYEKFRESLIKSKDIVNMAHLGARAFEEIGGEVVQTTAFVANRSTVADYLATYVRLVDFNSQQAKEDAFCNCDNKYMAKNNSFQKIPRCRTAYWIKINSIFDSSLISDFYASAGRNKTHNNEVFVRIWWECNKQTDYWLPYANGGNSRKWYGNKVNVVNWSNPAKNEYARHGGLIPQISCDSLGITWNGVSGNNNAFRIKEVGMSLSSSAPSIICDNDKIIFQTLAFLNTKVSDYLLKALNPTLQLNVGEVLELPFKNDVLDCDKVINTSLQSIDISRADWDSFETSWDFVRHPLAQGTSIKEAYTTWENACNDRFNTLKANEEELNRIFIDIYGLQDELTPEVADKDVTVRKADLGRDIRSFISYAVGCMFGRYSLDKEGLVFAGGMFDITKYKTFVPVKDNLLLINHINYFDNDIVELFADFVRTVYGEDALYDNLEFIAKALYPDADGTEKELIRRYFLNDFYKDHLKIYQKRPIYWQMDSGKKDGFKALFYLHRYDKMTIARVRGEYLLPIQRKYDAEIKMIEKQLDETDTADSRDKAEINREKTTNRKQITMLQAKMDECRIYDPIAAHLAYRQIELDLDDGVKVNYAKFQGIEVPMDDGTMANMDLLGKI